MTYKELLRLYKEGKLNEQQRQQIEQDIQRQDAISEYLCEEGDIPGLEDTVFPAAESGTEPCSERTTDESESDFQKKLTAQIQRIIRKAFIKLGVITGGLVLVIILCAVFILPQVVSLFYYNPNRSAGTSSETGISTTQMSLDLSVYSELFLPGGHRDYVSAMPLGYGAYDIQIPQTFSRNGRFTSAGGKLVRGKLTLYDSNVLAQPLLQFYIPGDTSNRVIYTKDEQGNVTEEDSMQDDIAASKKQIAGYNDTDWYLAYVSLSEITDYGTFISWINTLDQQGSLNAGDLWCAVYAQNQDGHSISYPPVGFSPEPSGSSMNWDREKYPYLSLLDDEKEEYTDISDEATMKTHFQSMLSYMCEHDDILKMLGHSDWADDFSQINTWIDENGLKTYGFAICATKNTLQQLYDDSHVSYIQSAPLS